MMLIAICKELTLYSMILLFAGVWFCYVLLPDKLPVGAHVTLAYLTGLKTKKKKKYLEIKYGKRSLYTVVGGEYASRDTGQMVHRTPRSLNERYIFQICETFTL